MRLSPLTLKLLKSFVSINPCIHVKPGPMLETISPAQSILAFAKTDQEFPAEIVLHDVQRLLGILGVFKEPEIKFDEKFLIISDGTQNVRIVYADPGLIVTVEDNHRNLHKNFTPNAEFEIDENSLSLVRQSQAILRLPEYLIKADGKNIIFGTFQSINPGGDFYGMNVGKTKSTCKVAIPAENLKILPGSYKVGINTHGNSKWVGPEATYFIAAKDDKESDRFERRG
jgi:hypothetical protein